SFEFLWPLAAQTLAPGRSASRNARNDQACVLRVRGRYHSALLPADIGHQQEAALVDRGLGAVDVVLAPHHGSKTSSSPEFVAQVQAAHVVAQAGAWNRYGHPAAEVEARWQSSGAQFWRTDHHGAISLRSRADGLQGPSASMAARRYWQVH